MIACSSNNCTLLKILLVFLSLHLSFVSITLVQGFATSKALWFRRNHNWSIGTRASVDGTGTFVDIEDDDCDIASPLDWGFIDCVYLVHCPNADENRERFVSTRTILKQVNLFDRLEIKKFETDDEDRIRGCYNSHIAIFREILNKRSDGPDDINALIFEDNLYRNGEILKQESIDAISSFTEQCDKEWDVIHLSYIPYVPDLQILKTNNNKIVRLSTSDSQCALGTTAYVINSRAMRKIIEKDDERGYIGIPIPDAMAELFGETRYALNPAAFTRAPVIPSLVNPQLDDLRSILFQPAIVSFIQQVLISSGVSTTKLLFITIFLLLSISGISITSSIHSALEFARSGTLDGPLAMTFFSISVLFSLFSLAIITQGILLAPKPNAETKD